MICQGTYLSATSLFLVVAVAVAASALQLALRNPRRRGIRYEIPTFSLLSVGFFFRHYFFLAAYLCPHDAPRRAFSLAVSPSPKRLARTYASHAATVLLMTRCWGEKNHKNNEENAGGGRRRQERVCGGGACALRLRVLCRVVSYRIAMS